MARLIRAEAEGMVGTPAVSDAPPLALGRRAVLRAGEGQSTDLPSGPGLTVGADLTRKALTPIVCEIEARNLEEHGGFHREDGEAYLYVLAGGLTLLSELYAPLRLEIGDSVYFDARAGYALLNEAAQPCKAMLVFAGNRDS